MQWPGPLYVCTRSLWLEGYQQSTIALCLWQWLHASQQFFRDKNKIIERCGKHWVLILKLWLNFQIVLKHQNGQLLKLLITSLNLDFWALAVKPWMLLTCKSKTLVSIFVAQVHTSTYTFLIIFSCNWVFPRVTDKKSQLNTDLLKHRTLIFTQNVNG